MDLLDVALPYAENKTSRDDDFIIINTNAQSLCPKVNSFIDCFNELDAQLAIVTETWFGDSPRLEQDLDDLLYATGIAMLTKNRAPVGGVSYGGVAIAYRAASVQLQDLRYPNPDCFETIMAAGSMRGHSRKLVVIAAYMPPGDPVQRGRSCLKHISEMVSEAKRRFSEPMIVVSGDFNQWPIGNALADYVDLVEVDVGPTRGSRSIDRIFLNLGSAVVSKGTTPPCRRIRILLGRDPHALATTRCATSGLSCKSYGPLNGSVILTSIITTIPSTTSGTGSSGRSGRK